MVATRFGILFFIYFNLISEIDKRNIPRLLDHFQHVFQIPVSRHGPGKTHLFHLLAGKSEFHLIPAFQLHDQLFHRHILEIKIPGTPSAHPTDILFRENDRSTRLVHTDHLTRHQRTSLSIPCILEFHFPL